jgi:hypothetical protein
MTEYELDWLHTAARLIRDNEPASALVVIERLIDESFHGGRNDVATVLGVEDDEDIVAIIPPAEG